MGSLFGIADRRLRFDQTLRGNAVKWINVLVVGAVVALGGGMFAVSQNQNNMEQAIKAQLLQNPQLPVATWADISIEARDLTLNGVTTDKAELEKLISGLSAMPEIASISNNAKLAPLADPFEFNVQIENGAVKLSGHMPSAQVQQDFLSQLPENVQAEFTLASGGPAAKDWRELLDYSTRLFDHFDQGEISARGLKVSFAGRAKNHDSFRDLDLIANAGFPDNLKRGTAEIIPPYEEDFALKASVGANGLVLDGFVPNTDTRAALKEQGADISNVLIASGAPENFERDINQLIQQLTSLNQGEFSLSEAELNFTGHTDNFEVYDQVNVALNAVSRDQKNIDLPLPTVAPFTFSLAGTADAVKANGYIPAAMADELITKIDLSETRAANGAPENFDEIAAWMGNSQAHLADNWALELQGNIVNVTGQAKTPEAYMDLLAHAAQPPAGVTIDLSNLDLAVAEPYIWTLDKSGSGKVQMAGYLPDSQLRQTIYAVLDTKADDTTLLAAGAPEDFGVMATLAAKTINIADSGQAIHDQLGWTTDVTARDLYNKNNILQLFSNEEIQPEQLGLQVAQLPPPLQDPYRFAVTKTADGARSFEGFVPSEAMLINLADQGTLELEIARGAPSQFEEFVALGNSVLSGLETGKLQLNGDKWTLEGTAESFEKKQSLLTQIEEAGLNSENWTIEITSPAQTISPYLFSAEKQLNGDLSASGFAPSQEIIDQWAQDFGWRAQLQVGAGASGQFMPRAAIGLEALKKLDAGRLSLVDGQWALIGRASSDDDLAEIVEILAPESEAFLVDVQILPPVEALSLQIKKSAEGVFEWSGYLSDETYWDQSGDLPVSTENSLPERAEFNQMVALGIDALSMLNTGEVIHAGGQWSISGEAPDRAVLSAVKLILSNAPLGSFYTTLTVPAEPETGMPEPEMEEPAAEETAEVEAEEPQETEQNEQPQEPIVEEAEPVVEQEAEEAEATPVEEETAPVVEEANDAETAPAEEVTAPEEVVEPEVEAETPAVDTNEEAVPAESEPEVEEVVESAEPFTTLLSKEAGAPLTISGNVPDATARYALELSAGEGAVLDDISTAEGAPERFLDQALTITQAFGALESGEASLNDGEWRVVGKVDSFDARDKALAALGRLPNAQITINTPPAHKLCNVNVEQVIAEQAILFESGSARITAGSRSVLEKIAAELANCPNSVVEVEGHTDADGDDLINLSLSVQRAETVVSELVEMGVNADRLYALGFGETLPIADNDTRAGKAQNRRIVFTVRPPLE